MINDESFDRYQFVISFELLKLLEWLIDHEQESLKQLIKRAVDHGFPGLGMHQMEGDPEELQQNVIDFFALIDALLHETVNEEEAENVLQRSLIPAINSIDATMYDSGAYSTSVAKATAAASRPKGGSPKEILCKELLKRWKPHKKANFN
jgi:hypothetical protein